MKLKEIIPKLGINVVLILIIIILAIFATGALICTGVFSNEYINSLENITYKFDNIIVNLILIVIATFIIYIISKIFAKIKPKYVLIGAIAIYALISISWILFSKAPLRADQQIVENVARNLIQGNFIDFNKGMYMGYHPLQISIVVFIEAIYRIAGNFANPIIIKFLNVIFQIIAFIYIYKITGLLFKSETVQKTVIVLLLGCFVFMLWTTLVYGNILGLMLGIIAIYYTLKYLEEKKFKYLIFMSIAIILSVIIKSNYQIYMIGIIITLLLELFKKIDIKIVVTVIAILGIFIISNKVIIKLMEQRLGNEINGGIPMISYIDMGLAKPFDRASGWYNAKVDVEKIYRENEFDTKRASESSKESLKNRLIEMAKEPKETLIFFADKTASTWIEPTYQSIWINEPAEMVTENPEYYTNNKILISIYQGKLNKILVKYLDIFQIIIYSFSTIYIIMNFKKITNKEVCMLIIFFGGVLFHIMWETKSLYAIPYYILLFPYCAKGLEEIFTKVEKYKNKCKIKGE